jgi:hypothetical protein
MLLGRPNIGMTKHFGDTFNRNTIGYIDMNWVGINAKNAKII